MENDKIYPGMLIRNCMGDVGWIVSDEYVFNVFGESIVGYLVEWNTGLINAVSSRNILYDHQSFLDLQKQHGV